MNNPFKDLGKGEILALSATFALLAVFSAYLVLHVKDARHEGAFDRRPPISDLFSGKGELEIPELKVAHARLSPTSSFGSTRCS